eukprot:8838199-Pyramimonas_sp.AAC.1
MRALISSRQHGLAPRSLRSSCCFSTKGTDSNISCPRRHGQRSKSVMKRLWMAPTSRSIGMVAIGNKSSDHPRPPPTNGNQWAWSRSPRIAAKSLRHRAAGELNGSTSS